jgi:hypothetical protein
VSDVKKYRCQGSNNTLVVVPFKIERILNWRNGFIHMVKH